MHDIFWWFIPLVALLGLAFGSFATALVHRIPRDISWISDRKGPTRSACPSCGGTLGMRDLVPVFSWLATRGRCRYCGSKISIAYPLTELFTAAICLTLYAAWGVHAVVLPVLFAVPFLVAALLIDWKHFILPDDINAALFLLAVIYVTLLSQENGWSWDVVIDAGLAAVLLPATFAIAGMLLSKIKKRPALGLGDVKFLVPAGLFIGTAALPSFMIVGGLAGIATGLIRGRGRIDIVFPFGPGLIASLLLHLFLTGMRFDHSW